MSDITLSVPAMQRLTTVQKSALLRLADSYGNVRVTTAFDLPAGYLAFTAGGINGGIAPDGQIST